MGGNGDSGKFQVDYPQPLVAGRQATISFEYEVGPRGFTEASLLRLCLPNTGWDPPLPPEPYFWPEYQRGPYRQYTEYGRCNTSAEIITRSGVIRMRHGRHAAPAGVPLADPARGPALVLAAQALMLRPGPYPNSRIYNMRRWWITVRVDEGVLAPGDRIRVIYGDPREEYPGATVQRFPEDRLVFLAFVDLEGRGHFEEVSGSPVWFEVIAGPPERIQAVVPSIVRPSHATWVRVAYTDRVEARPSRLPEEGQLDVRLSGEAGAVASSRFSRPAGPEVTIEIPPPAAPVARFCVRDNGRGYETLTNPVIVRASGPRLFWGDLQHQSMYHGYNVEEGKGISVGTPEEGYAYAREIAGLDFVAETNSGSFHRPEVWTPIRDAALAAYRPGEFVTFQSAEVGDNYAGHRCIFFRGSDPEPGVEGTLADTAPRAMHNRYRGRRDVLLIPHHTKMWFSWDSWDPELEPVMEIHSVWGSSERPGLDRWPMRECQGGSAQEALARGYRLGFVGGSDNHTGMPGRALRHAERDEFHTYGGGLTAVWAEELTREAIFDSVRARHCYATSGARIFLDLRFEGARMGSELAWPERSRPRRIAIEAHGTCALRSVALVKNNRDLHAWTWRPRTEDAQLEFEDTEPARSGDYYYVRVIQEDEHHAWSSPIWIV